MYFGHMSSFFSYFSTKNNVSTDKNFHGYHIGSIFELPKEISFLSINTFYAFNFKEVFFFYHWTCSCRVLPLF